MALPTLGIDASGSPPTIGNVLADVTVSQWFWAQNQSAATLQFVMSDAEASLTPTFGLLAPAAGAGQAGAATPQIAFAGRVRICGPAGSQFALRYQ